MRKVAAGRLREVSFQSEVVLVRPLQTISAIAGLWGTRCGRWPTVAALTCTVVTAGTVRLFGPIPEKMAHNSHYVPFLPEIQA